MDERFDTPYSDDDLLSSSTACIHLDCKHEHQVTEAIKALRLILRYGIHEEPSKMAVSEASDSCIALEYLRIFSSGLEPGEARYIVYRYLKANCMNSAGALREMMNAAELREKQLLNRVVLFPCLVPMNGFDQWAICKELRLLYGNTSCDKQIPDHQGRPQLEHGQGSDCGVPWEEHQSNMMTAEVSRESEFPAPTRSSSYSSRKAMTLFQKTAASTATGEFQSGLSSSIEKKQVSGSSQGTGGAWHLFASFMSFVCGEGMGRMSDKSNTEKTTPSAVSPGPTRNSSFHSIVSMSGDTSSSVATSDRQTSCMAKEVVQHTGDTVPAVKSTVASIYEDSLNLHGILQPIIEVITRHVQFAFHYYDLHGHPVMYCRLGGMHSRKLMQELLPLTAVDAEPRTVTVLFTTYFFLVLEQLIRYCNRQNRKHNILDGAHLTMSHLDSRQQLREKSSCFLCSANAIPEKVPVGTCTVVIDCAGVNVRRYLYKPLLAMVRSTIEESMPHFPELIHHVYVVNCNAVVRWSYRFFRLILKQNTRDKITFCGKKSTAATLRQMIGSDMLPEELGGTCRCPGGCIPFTPATRDEEELMPLGHSSSWAHLNWTPPYTDSDTDMAQRFTEERLASRRLHCTSEQILVKARASRKLSFAMDAQSEIVWEFAVKRHSKVTFSVLFASAGNDGAMLSVVQRCRVQEGAGHYIAPSIGTVILEWCNKHSLFSRCSVSLKVYHERTSAAVV
ncbi:hypothetical protein JKF63_02488 [Porcisia hertigi]|uniref:CRAL-TRIO domain-containing protein n=1 Tax=Porcisia hertigi TaxID=2761500 RepID=A0A836I125_9TRYP|nr:hypothetical protein JKF63_02488 [Porcisia hertigi]